MKVLYDHQAFSSFAYGGVSRIFYELMNSYSRDTEITFDLALKYSDNVYLKDSAWNTTTRPYLKRISDWGGIGLPVHLTRNFVVKRINNHRKNENRRNSEKILAEGKYDIFHPTYFDPYFLNLLQNKPFVLTVYDLIHELFPEYFPSSRKFLEARSLLVQHATRIIAISEHTKKDLMTRYHLPGEKIDVVYLANALGGETNVTNNVLGKIQTPERYLLYVGNRALYKNFLFFIESITPLLLQDKNLSIVCAGGKEFTQEEKKYFLQWGVMHNMLHIHVNDTILSSLYKNALAFVYPSLYEGFGIPILEAFACNCPVLISNTSSLPEVAGDACVSFDPKEKASILDAVNLILSNKSLQDELRIKGRERVRSFSWDRTAKEIKQIYKKVLQG
jgi:glycosyltransferase involved in cell wall biosynthesis